MKSPFLKYQFICKHCGKESGCRLHAYDKMRLLELHKKPSVDQRCQHCGHQTHYHFDRLYAQPRLWVFIVIWAVAFMIAYFGSMALYNYYENLEEQTVDRLVNLTAVFVGTITFTGIALLRLSKYKPKFNLPVNESILLD